MALINSNLEKNSGIQYIQSFVTCIVLTYRAYFGFSYIEWILGNTLFPLFRLDTSLINVSEF